MGFPDIRMRRLRENKVVRNMVRETKLSVDDLIQPLFVVEGIKGKEEIRSMPGQYRYSVDEIVNECRSLYESGIQSVILFGVPEKKDEEASGAYAEDGIVQTAFKAIKDKVPELMLIGDVCLCEYTSHGHCGKIEGDRILNDPSVDILAKTALSQVKAGADMVAPSDMMDGRVGAMRELLDDEGYEHIPIMSYAAKYASAYYGPFRDAAESAPSFGDRRSYQMDPANVRQALAEVELDIIEGADIVMVKPALAYLDVIKTVRDQFDVPVAAYNVSGEYSMLKAAVAAGYFEEKRIVLETLTGIKRAGADIILTYHAKDVVKWL